jgi:Putative beta-lactamase-inhibitor-like, PepSY-like
MKFSHLTVFIIAATVISYQANSQVTTIPEQAKESFFKQYPDAKNVKWENNVVNVQVRFEQDSSIMMAEYNNKGIWKNTLKDWSYDQLTNDVKDGFNKSKYAGREVTDVKVLYLPGYVIQYRVKVEKSGVEKKYLFFSTEGKLVRTTIAI